jgi:YcxB-like protein
MATNTINGATVIILKDIVFAHFANERFAPSMLFGLGLILLYFLAPIDAKIRLFFFLTFLVGIVLLASPVVRLVMLIFSYRRLGEEQKRVSYLIDSEEIRMQDDSGATITIPWRLAKRCIEMKAGFSIAMRPGGARWLPKRAFTPDSVKVLRDLIRTRVPDTVRLDG